MTTPFNKGIPSDSSLPVPQELIDYILDFLHDNVTTLWVCSLVTRAFLPCGHHLVYSNIFIAHTAELSTFQKYAGQLHRCQNLTALLEYSPHVASLVTLLGIHANSWFIANEVFEDASLSHIIQSLHNLFRMEVITGKYLGSWVKFPVHTTLFLAALRSLPLKMLILKGIDFQKDARFEDAFTAAAVNPALRICCLRGLHQGGSLRHITKEQRCPNLICQFALQ
ncbi:hypothetical protein ARMGADRAFT_1091749 [Armillaria gallica]|uniref:F-box domain-containing protein n=1 Tax=Armillaria gallica TaxID=47427 RepID=A0A2H3D0G2_ARMGA|nr:hypothetical protein ARMGADRAFT_1091749 [Armillaria gallica]